AYKKEGQAPAARALATQITECLIQLLYTGSILAGRERSLNVNRCSLQAQALAGQRANCEGVSLTIAWPPCMLKLRCREWQRNNRYGNTLRHITQSRVRQSYNLWSEQEPRRFPWRKVSSG